LAWKIADTEASGPSYWDLKCREKEGEREREVIDRSIDG